MIKVSEDEKEKFKSLIQNLNKYSANFLVYYLINYNISYGKDQMLANKIISEFWLNTFKRAEAEDVYDQERISMILEHFCLVKIQDYFNNKNNHMLIYLNFYPDLYKKYISKGKYEASESDTDLRIGFSTFFTIWY